MIVTGLRKIESWVVTIAIIANVSGAIVLLALVAIMNVDVVSRNLFNAPFRGVVEVVIFSLALIVFLQLPDVVRTGRLTRSDGFLGLLRSRSARAGGALARVLDATACVFMCLIVWTVWPEFTESFESCHFFVQPEFGPAPTGNLWADFRTGLARSKVVATR